MTAAQAVPLRVQQVLDRLDGVTGAYPQWSARCPAHDDRHASLSVGVGDDGLAMVTCHGGARGGCDWSALRPALLARQVPETILRGSNPPAPASGRQTPEHGRPPESRRREARRLAAVPDQDAVDRYVWAISEEQIQDVSEWRGIGEAIAVNLMTMAELAVPIIATVIGEGGSGGALALGVADRLLMLEYAFYSVASPEGSAAILWKDASKAPDAAKVMKITAPDLLALGVADDIVPEPEGGAHLDNAATIAAVGDAIKRHLRELATFSPEQLRAHRYNKYRSIGAFQELQTTLLGG
jgi:hypothetical protein